VVDEEIERLNYALTDPRSKRGDDALRALIGDERFEQLDVFDRVQLEPVVELCRESKSLSEAGRALFSASRGRKAITNDADRLRKYLARFGIE
jgi:transcriptional regulatory protein RtcR